MQPENNALSEAQIRNMIFGLNMKIPVYFEMRENIDKQIRTIHKEIAALNARLSSMNGSMMVEKRRGSPPKALIEAAEVPTVRVALQQKRRRHNLSEDGRKKISAVRRAYWANLTPRAKAAVIKKQLAGRVAAQKARAAK